VIVFSIIGELKLVLYSALSVWADFFGRVVGHQSEANKIGQQPASSSESVFHFDFEPPPSESL
jgi:hypothetical protein